MLFLKRRKNKNRRKHPRINSHNLIAIHLTERALFNLINISESGLQFSSSRHFEKKELLNVSVNLAEINSQISALSRVVWIRGILYGEIRVYRVGVIFVELNQRDLETVRQFIGPVLRAA